MQSSPWRIRQIDEGKDVITFSAARYQIFSKLDETHCGTIVLWHMLDLSSETKT